MVSEHRPRRNGRPSTLRFPKTEIPTAPITKAAFARLLGCAKSRVTEFVQEGIVSERAVTDAGLIVPSVAVAQLLEHGAFADAPKPVAAVSPITAPHPGMTYDEARTAKETLAAHRALLDLRERRGELVETAIATDILFTATRTFRDGLVTWPVRVAAEMAARLNVPPAALLAELEKGIRDFLAGLADPRADWRQGAKR